MLWNDADDAAIARLDPLDVDEEMRSVPQLNEASNVTGLGDLLAEMCDRARLPHRNYYEVSAIVRDMGIVAGSLRRHGAQPCETVPRLAAVFLEASLLTELPARDTLMHYTVWNPSGSRLRTYTAHEQEPHLIASIQRALPPIREATRGAADLRSADLRDRRSVRVAYLVARRLREFLNALAYAIHSVDPAVFISTFRPFFEPITVGPSELRGPGAVTMPLHIFDYLVWGSSEPQKEFQAFVGSYVPYNTAEFRQYYLTARNTPSLLDRLNDARFDRQVRPLLLAVGVWFRRLHGFRHAHLKYAHDAYDGTQSHDFKTGSGGHTSTDLVNVARLTEKHGGRVLDWLRRDS